MAEDNRPGLTPPDEVRRIRRERAEAGRRRGGQTGNRNAEDRRDAGKRPSGPPAHRAFDTYTRDNAATLRRTGFVVDRVRRHARLGRVSVIAEPGRFVVGNTARPQDGSTVYTDPVDAFSHAVTAHGKARGRFEPQEPYWPADVPRNPFGVGMRFR